MAEMMHEACQIEFLSVSGLRSQNGKGYFEENGHELTKMAIIFDKFE